MTIVFYTEKKVSSDEFILASYSAYCRLNGSRERSVSVDRTGEKPVLSGDRAEFSLSHSGKYTVCAMSESPVGVDIQEIKDIDTAAISERFFGVKITDKSSFFDEFSKGEATVKRFGLSFPEGMRRREGKNYDIFDGYSFAVCGTEPIYFSKLKSEKFNEHN